MVLFTSNITSYWESSSVLSLANTICLLVKWDYREKLRVGESSLLYARGSLVDTVEPFLKWYEGNGLHTPQWATQQNANRETVQLEIRIPAAFTWHRDFPISCCQYGDPSTLLGQRKVLIHHRKWLSAWFILICLCSAQMLCSLSFFESGQPNILTSRSSFGSHWGEEAVVKPAGL